ncbi:hypothetical protein A9R05_41870 (plasmid) [Burkholderia sp. KK1]|uniref:Uncharacterized protein n=1 Tax=Burkholderia sp. M701 TaxID=326454 RepID=V5YNK2_9BURK|nr:hypothetical protein [Burkholderia sp. M701]AQH05574.1 hypothetical protein A9R05_41870 [Burkholderia sp. KK1]BAO18839.1 hypothetical protein [Burkholderia sp. M701]
MSLIKLDVIRTEFNTPDYAYLNPEQILALAAPAENPDGWTHIYLDAGGKEKVIVTDRSISSLLSGVGPLSSFGPFIEITRFPLQTPDPWPVWHVRAGAIVSMERTPDGRGTLMLRNGREFLVRDPDIVAPLIGLGR